MKKDDVPPEALRQNLEDAGCDEETVERCLDCARQGRTQEQLRLLSAHRRLLLDAVHRCEKQIDCLDYLVFHSRARSAPGRAARPRAGTSQPREEHFEEESHAVHCRQDL